MRMAPSGACSLFAAMGGEPTSRNEGVQDDTVEREAGIVHAEHHAVGDRGARCAELNGDVVQSAEAGRRQQHDAADDAVQGKAHRWRMEGSFQPMETGATIWQKYTKLYGILGSRDIPIRVCITSAFPTTSMYF